MAKKRRVERKDDSSSQTAPPTSADSVAENDSLFGSLLSNSGPAHPLSIAAMLFGALIVYSGYFPSDSVAVEEGDALWFSTGCLFLSTLTLAFYFWKRCETFTRMSVAIDVIALALAGWMMLAAFASSPPGNLREATNEGWFWVGGCALFVALRRLLAGVGMQRAAIGLTLVCTICFSVHALHQQFVSLPQLRAEYLVEPDATLEKIGLNAPKGSSERMVFESRLNDGGPSATFALANSLAGLLVAGLAMAVAVLRLTWAEMTWARRACSLLGIILLFAGLYYLRSRSATLAALVAVVGAFVLAAIDSKKQERSAILRLLLIAASVCAGLAVLIGVGLAAFANAEWIEEAPESFAFRLQYWQTTFAMTMDRPLFSAGPGNFQSIYDQYRAASANEQIAEPHSFFFETLGAGGFVAAGLLVALAGSLILFSIDSNESQTSIADTNRSNWVWAGAGIVLATIWLMGIATGNSPDLSASLIALPVAIAIGFGLWPIVNRLGRAETRIVAIVGLSGMMIHLCASGGWTIPGVAICIWTLAGVVAPATEGAYGASTEESNGRSKSLATITLFTGVVLLLAIRWMSTVPVQIAASEIRSAQYFSAQGSRGQAEAAVDRAILADPWSPKAALWRAGMLHWDLVRGDDSVSRRDSWNEKLELAKSRGGQDPPLLEVVGLQQLHLYQRFGNRDDLAAARETFLRVVQWSPSDQKSVAQLAVIQEQMGETAEARKLAKRAEQLSTIGDNLERSLSVQLIYSAKHGGMSAKEAPIQEPASRLLANLLQ